MKKTWTSENNEKTGPLFDKFKNSGMFTFVSSKAKHNYALILY